MIRGKVEKCPFGLPIIDGCNAAGGSVSGDTSEPRPAIADMIPLDEAEDDSELSAIIEENIENLLLINNPKKCPFADSIMKEKKCVDCKFDKNQPGMPAGNVGLNGSPLYPQLMIGNGESAQYGYPLDYYSDNNESRSVYYGLYSLVG